MTYEDEAQWRAEVLAGMSSRSAAVVTAYNWPSSLVEVDDLGRRQWMPWAGAAPWKGGTVRVITVGGEPTAFAVHGAAQGTVQSVTAGLVSVVGDDGSVYIYPHVMGDVLSTGHRVALDHQRQLVIGRYSAEPPASEFVGSTAPSQPGSASFSATDSGRWNLDSGVFRDQRIRADVDNGSAVFFGTQIADSVGGRSFTTLQLRLLKTYDYYPSTVTQLAYHASATRGSLIPSFGGGIDVTGAGVGEVTVVDLMPWASLFQSGAARGVGFYGGSGQREFNDFSTSSIYGEWS